MSAMPTTTPAPSAAVKRNRTRSERLGVHEDERRQYSASERDMIEHLYREKGPPPDKG
jgi:hypothetical protein